MKHFLKKRWHSIPVALVSALLVLALVAGGAFAAFNFFTATANVTVVEAVAVGAWDTWDNLEPYGSVDDVDIVLTADGAGNPVVTITTAADDPYVGEGFCAGEWIVIPLNIRNGSDGDLNLSASVTSDGLITKASYEENTGQGGTITVEDGRDFCRDFEALGAFTLLSNWTAKVDGNSGESGSAVVGAQVLFVKIIAPGDLAPGEYTVIVELGRS